MNRIIILIAFIATFLGCEKQTPEPTPTLSEYIIGEWEVRESMDRSEFGNREFNSVGPPYGVIYSFAADQTCIIWFGEDSAPVRTFSVNEQDSILTLGTSEWELYSFDEAMIDIRFGSTEGPIGTRLYKID